MLEARAIAVAYRRPRRPVLDGVDLRITPGQVVGLYGPSGCGKSTLTRILALVQPPDTGTVAVDGELAPGWRLGVPRRLISAIGFLDEDVRSAFHPRLTLAEIIAAPLQAAGRGGEAAAAVRKVANEVALPVSLLHRRAGEVKDNDLRRAGLARALVLQPRYLVCDGLPPKLAPVVVAYVRRTGAGALATNRDDDMLTPWCDEVHHLRGQPARLARPDAGAAAAPPASTPLR